jgi:hypothetical protein
MRITKLSTKKSFTILGFVPFSSVSYVISNLGALMHAEAG